MKKKEPVVTEQKQYEIPGLPSSDGPKSSQRSITSRKKDEPVIIILKPGAFQYVWEMLELKGRLDHQKYSSIPNITETVEEAIRSFRAANSEALTRRSRWMERRKASGRKRR